MQLYQDQKGFSLIEVLAAVIILAVAILGVTAAFIEGRRQIEMAKRITVATKLAQEKMDDLRRQLATGTTVAGLYATYSGGASFVDKTSFRNLTLGGRIVAKYALFKSVSPLGAITSPLPAGTTSTMLKVDVTVRWTERVFKTITTTDGGTVSQPVDLPRDVTLTSVLSE